VLFVVQKCKNKKIKIKSGVVLFIFGVYIIQRTVLGAMMSSSVDIKKCFDRYKFIVFVRISAKGMIFSI
jgi:hypothetical protein